MSQQPFGQLSNGDDCQLYILKNTQGTCVSITNYGGIIIALSVADNLGNFDDIVLGYDTVADYEKDTYYLGAIVGRYAGRIKNGSLIINDKSYQLTLNASNSHLHGGSKGLNKRCWQTQSLTTDSSATVKLTYVSPDGEEGYPGTVTINVSYTLSDDNELIVEYRASTDAPTILNLTQHSYFNLAGHDSGTIENHELTINADHYLPMSEEVYPTGGIETVTNSPHDFRVKKPLGKEMKSQDSQIIIAKGYDNYWLLNDSAINQSAFSAQVTEPSSGRRMTIFTDQPSIILYTANYIDGSHIGKNNCPYQGQGALCLEPVRAVTKQHINKITPVMLLPNLPFYSQTRYLFDTVARD
ncbi:aldose epimerase family protein [Thalassotalea piscium]